MTNIVYEIKFLSDWHCGSGLSSGADLDLLCIKDQNGLPFIPGKTLKGLLRDAASIVCQDNFDFIDKVFGKVAERKTGSEEKNSVKGISYFSSGELSETLQGSILKDIGKKEFLFRKISSTRIDENGKAETHSLRGIEVVVPLTLYAEITEIPDEESKENLIKCLKYIKRLGTNRNRGLGRCVITKVENNGK